MKSHVRELYICNITILDLFQDVQTNNRSENLKLKFLDFNHIVVLHLSQNSTPQHGGYAFIHIRSALWSIFYCLFCQMLLFDTFYWYFFDTVVSFNLRTIVEKMSELNAYPNIAFRFC